MERGMADYIFLMHDDATAEPAGWEPYLRRLQQSGRFQGGSAIGPGHCVRRRGAVPPVTAHLAGYIRVTADSLADAEALLADNPHLEAGGTVEIRLLPRTD
jgi:hypothetical protein